MDEDHKVVLFADILGFARLTEDKGVDLSAFRELESASLPTLKAAADGYRINRLAVAYTHFHTLLNDTLRLAREHFPLTSISFSDSVFIATDLLKDAVQLASDLMVGTLLSQVPIRVGIAHGSFATVRFRADVSQTGGDHAAQFLGTSVVRAHAAESCGIKGMRILLHPSVVPYLLGFDHNPTRYAGRGPRLILPLECSPEECRNRAGVSKEINYRHLFNGKHKATAMTQAVRTMKAEAPPDALLHYTSTLAAFRRMHFARYAHHNASEAASGAAETQLS